MKLKTNMLHFFMEFLSRISEEENQQQIDAKAMHKLRLDHKKGVVEIPPHEKIWKSLELIDALHLDVFSFSRPHVMALINDALKFKSSYSKTDAYSRKKEKRG